MKSEKVMKIKKLCINIYILYMYILKSEVIMKIYKLHYNQWNLKKSWELRPNVTSSSGEFRTGAELKRWLCLSTRGSQSVSLQTQRWWTSDAGGEQMLSVCLLLCAFLSAVWGSLGDDGPLTDGAYAFVVIKKKHFGN